MQKNKLELKCQYSVRVKNDQCYTTIHCERCAESSSLRNTRCRKNVLEILQVEFQTDCLILAKQYEREYRDKSLELLKELAKLQNLIGELKPARAIIECDSCDLMKIIELSRSDPAIACLKLKMVEKKCSECELQEIINLISKNPVLSIIREKFDYERDIHPYTRPGFSTTRLNLEPPSGATLLKSYEIRKHGRRPVQVAIYSLAEKPENVYFIMPMEYNLPAEELQILLDARTKLIRHRPVTPRFSDHYRTRDFLVEKGREIISLLAKERGLDLASEEINSLADLFAKYTADFGILEDLLIDQSVQDVYVNS